jgi:hypothetical protein
MPISELVAAAHVATQCSRLSTSSQRGFWPRFLYHATHVTNAVGIVRDGFLGSREAGIDFHDVANQGALAAYESSHKYARLYFRPKNPYHLRTEGIKPICDPYRLAHQASIPVMFLFDAEKILTRAGTVFTAGNIQRGKNVELSTDEHFSTLDFNAIYHDDAVSAHDKEYIHDRRMAEVMIPEALPLENYLRWVVFRTPSDLLTFNYLLGKLGSTCGYPRGTETVNQSIFMHWGLYIRELNFIEDKLTIDFHLPRGRRPFNNEYKINVTQTCSDGSTLSYNNSYPLARPSITIKGFSPDGASVWKIVLEDVLAFEGRLPHEQSALFG